MRNILVVVLFLVVTGAHAQGFHGLYFNAEYRTNFDHQVFGGTLDYETRFTIDSMIHLASFGIGGEVNDQKQFLTDVKFSWALTQGWICHLIWFERFPEWYVAAHYRFSPDFSTQYICPETGFNFRINSWLFATPAINYYWDLRCTCNWKRNFYPTFKLVLKPIRNRFT